MALIVTTDYGYLLGEHQWWAKSIMPLYNEIAHIPMFAWDSRVGKRGERRSALVQNMDIAATVLELNGQPLPQDMLAKPIRQVIEDDIPIHDCILFGHHASHVNITDGRYVYLRAPFSRESAPAFEYTLMPTHIRSIFRPKSLRRWNYQSLSALPEGSSHFFSYGFISEETLEILTNRLLTDDEWARFLQGHLAYHRHHCGG